MKKVKYYYNTQALRYEKFEEAFRTKFMRILGFISAALVFAFIIVYLAYTYLDSPKEKALRRELTEMQLEYDLLNKKLDQMSSVVADLEERDDNIYRVIFEAEPIPSSIRQAGSGGINKYRELMSFDNGQLMASTAAKMDQMRRQLYIQSKSYDEISVMIKKKAEVLASIPAIQPISNKQLSHIASGFGMRIDPIYKIPKMHEGLDFTAPTGTPIHATGNGTISVVEYGDRGYGNHVIINHMVGYQTHYAHMSRIIVREGQVVKRGDVIGHVGSTGKSTAPHCHYEVIRNGVKLDPVNFFFNDLTPAEYEEMLKQAALSNQSFD
ncbi:MAG: peptidoglycan DD-metalloendopeptidase family protein [Chitinophagaceae bacterium]|nr:peptidoglycan DD-metalloendopeptidase family protein [Chitinophagaceae bacterium]